MTDMQSLKTLLTELGTVASKIIGGIPDPQPQVPQQPQIQQQQVVPPLPVPPSQPEAVNYSEQIKQLQNQILQLQNQFQQQQVVQQQPVMQPQIPQQPVVQPQIQQQQVQPTGFVNNPNPLNNDLAKKFDGLYSKLEQEKEANLIPKF